MIGTTLGDRYRLERLLGTGGMGAVYEAVHTGTGRRVALKVIRDIALTDTDVFRRFEREAKASGQIDTRHIVEVLDSGLDGATKLPFMAMDLLRGQDLGALLERRGRLAVDLALRITLQACQGLVKAHAASVVHRDIKPANLFLSEEEDEEILVKLLDFGIAKVRPSSPLEAAQMNLTQTGRLLGTPLYMSPEQAEGARDVDHRTDIWSLGCVLYEALTGRSPHAHAETLGKLIVAITTKPVLPPSAHDPAIPPAVDAIVQRALAIDRAQRYPRSEDLLADLVALLPGGAFVSKPELEGGEAPLRVSQPRLLLGKNRSDRNVVVPSGESGRVSSPHDETVAVEDVGVASTLFASNVTLPSPKRGRRGALLVGLSLAGASLLGLGVYAATRPPSAVSPGPVAEGGAPELASSPSALASAAPCPTFHVPVEPPDASVSVDGKLVPVVDGLARIEAYPGDLVVVLSHGGRQHKQILTIGPQGPSPSKLSLPEPVAEARPESSAAPLATPSNPTLRPRASGAPAAAASAKATTSVPARTFE